MKEKVNHDDYFDSVVAEREKKSMSSWQNMHSIIIEIPAKREAPRLSLLDRIELLLQNDGRRVSDGDRSLEDPTCLLLQVRSRFLTLLYSTATYSIYPPQEIEIVTTHRQLSKQTSAGVVDVYRKGKRVVQSQWNLSLSGGKLFFEVTCPLAVSRQLVALHYEHYPLLSVYYHS